MECQPRLRAARVCVSGLSSLSPSQGASSYGQRSEDAGTGALPFPRRKPGYGAGRPIGVGPQHAHGCTARSGLLGRDASRAHVRAQPDGRRQELRPLLAARGQGRRLADSADGRHVSAGRRVCGDGERLEAGRVGGYPGARRRRRVPRRRERNQRLRGIPWFGLPDRGLRPDSGPRPPARRAGGGGARAVQGCQRHREQGQPIRSQDDCFDARAADLLGGVRAKDHARADERDERPDLCPLPPEQRCRRRPWAVPHRRDISIRERLRGDEGRWRARSR